MNGSQPEKPVFPTLTEQERSARLAEGIRQLNNGEGVRRPDWTRFDTESDGKDESVEGEVVDDREK